MAQALRLVSTDRGYDPRGSTLVAYGGAGPLHACELAQALQIQQVLVPLLPGRVLGLRRAARRHAVRLHADALDAASLPRPRRARTSCSRRSSGGPLEDFRREGFAEAPQLVRSIDMRYVGQNWELNVAMPGGELTRDDFAAGGGAVRGRARALLRLLDPRRGARAADLQRRRRRHAPRGRAAAPRGRARAGRRSTGARVVFGADDGPGRDGRLPARRLRRPASRSQGPAIVGQVDATTLAAARRDARASTSTATCSSRSEESSMAAPSRHRDPHRSVPARDRPQPPHHDLQGDGDRDDADELLADVQRGARLLVRRLRRQGGDDRAGAVRAGADRLDRARRADGDRRDRRREPRAGRRRLHERPLPLELPPARVRGRQAVLPRGRDARLHGQHRPHDRRRRHGAGRLRRPPEHLPGGHPLPAGEDLRARPRGRGDLQDPDLERPHAEALLRRHEGDDRLPVPGRAPDRRARGRATARRRSCSAARTSRTSPSGSCGPRSRAWPDGEYSAEGAARGRRRRARPAVEDQRARWSSAATS